MENFFIVIIIIVIIIPKPIIFTETWTQESFWVSYLTSCNFLFETNNFGFGAVLLLRLVT
jgi:hypothetical protein